ncbi:MAG: MATE family efflux transporter [Sandarakinorhabdus sp.]|nr:MATE family efflux transporter [Sandarakinorhabdus sp.]
MGRNPLNTGQPASIDRAILAIALPAMLTNIATALIGLADIWVIGQLGAAEPQAGVEIGSKLFFFIVTIFNFISFGTTTLTAQAGGRGDKGEQAAVLLRSVAVATGLGILAFGIARAALPLGISALGGTGAVAANAAAYANVRSAAVAPALVNMALIGFLVGRKRLRTVLAIEVGYNLVHVAIAVALVLGFGLGVRGAALASLAAESLKLLVSAWLVGREGPAIAASLRAASTWSGAALSPLFRLNRDLFVRTLMLLLAIMVFTRMGAAQGPTTLAANAILFQLFLLSGMVMNGFEAAAQVLGAEAIGHADRAGFTATGRRAMAWMHGSALLLGLVLLGGGDAIANRFTRAVDVRADLAAFHLWPAILPLLAAACFVYDGLFIGAGWTRAMLVSMAGAFALYLAALALLLPFGNHGLWLAFCLLFVFRGGLQAVLMPGLLRRQFG